MTSVTKLYHLLSPTLYYMVQLNNYGTTYGVVVLCENSSLNTV